MPKAISYIRFSTRKQLDGSSLERQQGMVQPWLDANPQYERSDMSFQDLGISGRSGKHLKNGFGMLLEAIGKGGIVSGDVILVEAIDRAGRMDMLAMLEILTPILKADVSLITLDDGIKYDRASLNGANIYILAAKIQASYQYSDNLSRRMKASYAERNKLAKNDGIRPKRNTPVWLTSDGKMIDDIKPFIVQAFEDYASGLGERRIYERILQKGGDKTPSCFVKMAPSTVKRWMSNRTAIGEWQGIPDVYPAVVAPELFYRVQIRLNEVYVPRAAPMKHKYTGLVVCGECGKNFNTKAYSVRANGVTPPAVMECSTRARRGSTACSNSKGIPEAVIGLAFQLSCWKHISEAMAGQHLTDSQKREVEIEGELNEISKKIVRTSRALAETDNIDELVVQLREYKAEQKTLEIEKADLVHGNATISERLLGSISILDDPIKANALLQSVGYKLTCNSDGTINTPVGTFTYEGWGRADDVHKVVTHEGKRLKLPIQREGKERKPGKRIEFKMPDLNKIKFKVSPDMIDKLKPL